jgi:aryl-phospho-beta-D-glucosidase BglC (GH1 family)
MLDDFVDFWSKSSQAWTGNTNVIGYELINEPFAGMLEVKLV